MQQRQGQAQKGAEQRAKQQDAVEQDKDRSQAIPAQDQAMREQAQEAKGAQGAQQGDAPERISATDPHLNDLDATLADSFPSSDPPPGPSSIT